MGNRKHVTQKKFKREAKQYHIIFPEDHDNAGLEVLMRSLPIEEFLELTDLAGGAKLDTTVVRKLFTMFAGSLLEWNLQDDFDNDVPATYEGVQGQDLDFIMPIVMEWITAMSAVDIPLPDSSNSASNSESVASLPMETL